MTDHILYERAFEQGQSFQEFLGNVRQHRELWHAVTERVELPDEAVRRVRDGCEVRRVLVLADDWCGDAINTVPVMAALAEAAGDEVELRIVGREEFPEIMERHLTGGRSRSIPVAIALDEDGACRGWWGPRPEELQSWFEERGRAMPSDERYRELRRWYARDRGRSTAIEMAGLLAQDAAATSKGAPGGLHPCPEQVQAA